MLAVIKPGFKKRVLGLSTVRVGSGALVFATISALRWLEDCMRRMQDVSS